jgi:hypothetical protein
VVDYDQFNGAEVQQYRGVLEDIAAETGGRTKLVEVAGKGGDALKVIIEYADNNNPPDTTPSADTSQK